MDNTKEILKITFSNTVIGYKQPLFKIEHLLLETGKTIALMGKNGCGKTTLLQSLLGTVKPIVGEISINDVKLNQITDKERTKCISFVPSKFEGVQNLTVKQLVALGRTPFTNVLGKTSLKDEEKVETIIKTLELESIQDKSTHLISDGERQKAMIGKALAQETDIIILDEPTAFLDYSNRLKTIQLLSSLAKLENKLILFSSHNVDLAFAHCTEIIAINKDTSFSIYRPNEVDKESFIEKVY